VNLTTENSGFGWPHDAGSAPSPAVAPASTPVPVKPGAALPFDPWRLLAALLRRWIWIACAGAALSVLAGLAGYFKFTASFKSGAHLMRQEASATFRASELGEPFRPRQLSVATLVSFMKSPAVLQRVAEQTQLPARGISGGLTITPERNTDLITLNFVSSRSPQTAVRVLNAFGNEVVRLTREMQSLEAAEMNRLLKKQLAKTEEDLRAVNRELLEFSRAAGLVNADKESDAYLRSIGELDLRYETARIDFETIDLKIAAMERQLAATNPQAERLQQARERLAELLQQVTEANPLVAEHQAIIADLEARLKDSETQSIAPPRQGESGLATVFYADFVNLKTQKEVISAQLDKLKAVRAGLEEKLRGLPEKGLHLARIKGRQQSLETAQSLLASRQREAQLYEENSLGYYRFFEARLEEVDVAGRGKKLMLLAVAGGVLGVLIALAFVCLVESLDDRIKTTADLKRVTRLPLLASLPDLDSLDAVGQSNWAFRTWLALQAKLAVGPQLRVVLGFVAANGGEGSSTWIELLARAASQRNSPVIAVTNRRPINGSTVPLEAALDRSACVAPAPGVALWLIAPGDWRWDSAHRLQWAAALETWSQTKGLVVLLELNCADQPDTLLLAEQLPQLVWLSGSGVARARETSERLENFRHAGCRFVGAVLNREVKLFPWL
jgi:capsular polysaccharide biosynthesis protein